MRTARATLDAAPNNPQARRQLLIALSTLSEAQLEADDLGGARISIAEGLAIARALVSAAPNDAGLQRDLSIVLERLGDMRLKSDDRTGALSAYGESLALRRRRAEPLGPTAVEARRDVAMILVKIHEASYGARSEAALREAAAIAFDLDALGLLGPERSAWVAEMRARLSDL